MPSGSAASPPDIAAPDPERRLAERHRRLHRALIDAVLATGAVPAVGDLADRLAMVPEAVRVGLDALAAADYLAFDEAGRVGCLYPFSAAPTPHVVVIGERRRYAMCAIDALGLAAMLGREIGVEASCAACGAPIRLAVDPGAVLRAEPVQAIVVARLGGDEPAVETCCPYTVFACGDAHGRDLVDRLPSTQAMSLAEALGHGETIFGRLRAETLPAKRPRSRGPAPPTG